MATLLKILQVDEMPVDDVAFSPDGKTLVVSTHGGALAPFQTTSWLPRRLIKDEHCLHLAFAPDGKTLAAGTREVHLYDTATWRQTRRLTTGLREIHALEYTADGQMLTAIGGKPNPKDPKTPRWDTMALHAWEAASGRERRALDLGILHQGVRALAMAPDGTWIACAENQDRDTVRLRDAATGRERISFRVHSDPLIFTPNGKTLITVSGTYRDNAVRFWEVRTGRAFRSLDHRNGFVRLIAVSPDGRTLATAVAAGQVSLWDTRTGRRKEILRTGDDHTFGVLVFSPNSGALATAGSGPQVKVWRLVR